MLSYARALLAPNRSPFRLLRRVRTAIELNPRRLAALAPLLVFVNASSICDQCIADETHQPPRAFVQLSQDYCLDCHTGGDAEARLDISAMNDTQVSTFYMDWRRVARVLQEGSMPPTDAEQPPGSQLQEAGRALGTALQQATLEAADDPGPQVVRRLTNAEFDYCLEDLTGLRLGLGKGLVSDSVGGSGFTNSATAQFMQDVTMERYLEAAKIVAEHAMIGTGPLYFFEDPGQTGMEISAVRRIQDIYRKYGFRAAAGEGAEPYGMQRFPQAFKVCWQFLHREQLGMGDVSLSELAREADIEPKFALHIWEVLNRPQPQFPLDQVCMAWKQIPAPEAVDADWHEQISVHAEALFEKIQYWQDRLASSASDEEEAALLSGQPMQVPTEVDFVARAVRRRVRQQDAFTPDLNNASLYDKDGRVRLQINVEAASSEFVGQPAVVFSQAQFEFRVFNEVEKPPVPLVSVLTPQAKQELKLGEHPSGSTIGESEFVVTVGLPRIIEVELPDDCRVGELTVRARLDTELSRDAVVRCSIRDITNDGNEFSNRPGREYSSLLRDPNSERMDDWQQGLTQFALALPQISHREPTPSDRDPIPEPYDNTYNLPERNHFHTAVKYYRDDRFLTEHILPEAAIEELDRAWADLLSSFDYHDVNLRFTADKFGLELGEQTIASLEPDWLRSQSETVRSLLEAYRDEYQTIQHMLESAQRRHLTDLNEFASRAWRRPLTSREQDRLRDFYQALRDSAQSHAEALRGTLARVLVSPSFLYRVERSGVEPSVTGLSTTDRSDTGMGGELDPFSLASRLSFSIWSSVPDAELLALASSGELVEDAVLREQVQRMLASPKSRRMATEFFGQWLGFYQFDQFRGVDTGRFPEFDPQLQESLYDEAISFFEHILREDRPYSEIFQADYSVLDQRVAAHYGLADGDTATASIEIADSDTQAADELPEQVAPLESKLRDLREQHRGGVLGLGAILTSTSAPLRTSPVKRGDWVLRRLLGTPVPPPPADAGSIPAEEALGDGMTVRQRLEMHRMRAECMNCHIRIDPLGFSLENFDSLGRWREDYVDGKPVDASGTTVEGFDIQGVDGLRKFLQRQDSLLRRNLAARLTAYFLGRAETVYDAALIERIARDLEVDPRISTAVTTLVCSPQFQKIRQRGPSVAAKTGAGES
ncbi:MAG: DUF1592 domain-containing protein [bacterium]|nr:DUF1592 domain-containing protein [bacterium]